MRGQAHADVGDEHRLAGRPLLEQVDDVAPVEGGEVGVASALVDEAPKPVKEGIDREEADKLKGELEEAGGSVELK